MKKVLVVLLFLFSINSFASVNKINMALDVEDYEVVHTKYGGHERFVIMLDDYKITVRHGFFVEYEQSEYWSYDAKKRDGESVYLGTLFGDDKDIILLQKRLKNICVKSIKL